MGPGDGQGAGADGVRVLNVQALHCHSSAARSSPNATDPVAVTSACGGFVGTKRTPHGERVVVPTTAAQHAIDALNGSFRIIGFLNRHIVIMEIIPVIAPLIDIPCDII